MPLLPLYPFRHGLKFSGVLAAAISLSGASLAVAATQEFNTASGAWDSAANWTPSGVPSAGNDAHIGTSAAQAVTLGTGATGAADNVLLANASTLNLGGVLTTTGVGGYGVVTFDGGTLKAMGTGPLLNTATAASGGTNNTAFITGNGAVIDTNGFDTYIGVHLDNAAGQTGSLTKVGAGTLSISGCNFTGPATILEGSVDFGAKGYFNSHVILIGEQGRLRALGGFGYYMSSGDQLTMGLGSSGVNGFVDTNGFGTGGVNLVFDVSTSSLNTGDSWDFYGGGQTGNFASVSFSDQVTGGLTRSGTLWSGDAGGYSFSFDQSSGVLSVVGTVPEPGAWAMCLAAAGWVLARRSRTVRG